MSRLAWSVMVVSVLCYADRVFPQRGLLGDLDAHYREHPPSFPPHMMSLTSKTVSEQFSGGVRIHYVANQTVLVDTSLGGQFGVNGAFLRASGLGGEGDVPTMRVLRTKIFQDSDREYLFDFSPGPSMDPEFVLHRVGQDSTVYLGRLTCLDLFVPGDGFIYTSGHVNSMFEKRRRFTIDDDSLVETTQPFFRVGLETVTTGPLVLLSDYQARTVLDTLPTGTSITVLLNKDDLYLLTTPFGLTGWAVIGSGYNTPIRHLIYRGD